MDKLNRYQKNCLKIVESLPVETELYMQERGDFQECGCCVGAHLANHYGQAVGPDVRRRDPFNPACWTMDFIEGVRHALVDLGYAPRLMPFLAIGISEREQFEDDLIACGAPCEPFGTEKWSTHPRKVFTRLAYEVLDKRSD